MSKLKIIFSYSILVFSFFMSGLVYASINIDHNINEELNHANSYYWLARGNYNHPYYLRLSLEHIENAREIAESNNEFTDSLSFSKIIDEIELFELEVFNAIAVSKDNLNGKYRLYQALFGESDYFEEFDDPMDIAVERSLFKLININTLSPAKPLRDLMNYSIIKTIPDDNNLLEVGSQLLSSFTNTYVISQHELYNILDKTDSIKSNYDYQKIADFFRVENVGEFNINQLDKIGNLTYASSSFKLFNPYSNNVSSYTKSESIVIDKRGVNLSSLFNSITYYLISSFILIALLFLIFRKEKLYFLSFFTSSLLSIVLSFALIYFLSLIALPIDAFAESINSKIFSLFITFTLGIGVSILTILCLLLIFKRLFINDLITASIFFFGASIGGVFTLNYFYYFFYEFNFSNFSILQQLVVLFISSIFISKDFIKFDKQLNYRYLIKSCITLIPVFLIYENTLIDPESFSLFSGLTYTLLFIAIYLLDIFYFSNLKKIDTVNTTSIDDFEDRIYSYLNAENVIKLEYKDPQLSKLRAFFNESDLLNILYVSGTEGIGKTTFFKSLKENHNQFYYCDCDDVNDDSSVIPYEPFLEAFSPFIGKGIFYTADRYSKNVLESLSPVIEKSIVGTALLSNVRAISPSFSGANIDEILKELEDHFVSLILNENAKDFIFCIDNYHWIDEHSKRLFEQFMSLLSKIINLHGVRFLIIVISDEMIILDDVIKKNKLFNIKEYEIENHNLFSGDDFCEKLFDELSFDYNSNTILMNFFNDLNFSSPKYILQSLLYLFKNNFIENENNQLVLTSNKWKENLPIPSAMKEAFHNQLNGLDRKQMRLLELASFIGFKFEASILSSVWNIDRLEVIDDLSVLEKNKIVIDISEENDFYKFSSRPLYKYIKKSVSIHDEKNLSQLAKEYHIRICNFILNDESFDIQTYDLEILIQIANRYTILKDEYPYEFYKLNYFVAKRLFDFSGISAQFEIHINLLFDNRSIIEDDELLIKSFCLYLKFILIKKDFDVNENVIFSLIRNVIFHLKTNNSSALIIKDFTFKHGFNLDSFDYLFNVKSTADNTSKIKVLKTEISEVFNTPEDKLIHSFYHLVEHNEHFSKFIDLRQALLNENLSNSIIYGRVLNQLSGKLNYPDSLIYYFERIEQILKSIDNNIVISDDNCIKTVKHLYDEIHIQRKEDINYSVGGIARVYYSINEFDKSYDYACLAYEFNKKIRDYKGVSIYGNLTGDCMLNMKTFDVKSVEKHYAELFYTLDSFTSSSIDSLLLVILKWISFYDSNNVKSDKLNFAINNFEKKYFENSTIIIRNSFLFKRDSEYYKLFSELLLKNSFLNFLNKFVIHE